MNGGFFQSPTEPLHPTVHVSPFLIDVQWERRVCCFYHKTAWVWKRTRRAKEIDEIIKNFISNKHVNQ